VSLVSKNLLTFAINILLILRFCNYFIEQWEFLNLAHYQGDRGTKWTKYFNDHKSVLKDFCQFFSNQNEIDSTRVVREMQVFYKLLSERLHNAHSIGDQVEWRRKLFTPVQNKIAEYMCKELNIEYHIVESTNDVDNTSNTTTHKQSI